MVKGNYVVFVVSTALVLRIQVSKPCPFLPWMAWRWGQHLPNVREILTEWHIFTSQKTWILTYNYGLFSTYCAILYFRKIATSKFQPTYARQAYPCFDEPGFKPTFKVRLVKPQNGYTALSNMDQVVSVVATWLKKCVVSLICQVDEVSLFLTCQLNGCWSGRVFYTGNI